MAIKPKQDDALANMLAVASAKELTNLILQLAMERPDVRRECFDFLKTRVRLSRQLQKRSEAEIIFALWAELEPDLRELDEYGGGHDHVVEIVADLLDQIQKQLDSKRIEPDDRREILDLVLPYIKSGNSGLNDMLYDVAYGACYVDDDLRGLAESLERMGSDWEIENARRIYRRLGCRDKYLELRKRNMTYGGDYHDLATFYWESGEKEKALQVAGEGLRKGKGRMDELRGFLADRAEDTGDRETYLTLQFDQATDRLTLDKYNAFNKVCTPAEWLRFEPKMLERMKDAGQTEQLKIRMHRKEYDEAVGILSKSRYPISDWAGEYEIQTAKALEKSYPEKILKYYLSGLGKFGGNASRTEYARQAGVMEKVRYLLVEVLEDEERWNALAIKVKKENIRRPAFQQEFSAIVKGWQELS